MDSNMNANATRVDIPIPSAPAFDDWEPRFIGNEPRLSEIIETYRDIGYEVLVKPFDPAACADCCKGCFSGSQAAMVVYTRMAKQN